MEEEEEGAGGEEQSQGEAIPSHSMAGNAPAPLSPFTFLACRNGGKDNKTKTSIFINRCENESQKTLRIYINSCGKKGLTESMSWK